MHEMDVKTKYYNLLKSGEKTVELRLLDEKRQQIKIGDEITFSDASDANETFVARVVDLHKAESFYKLFDIIAPEQAGFSSREEVVDVMQEFYPLDMQKQFSVVGIEVERV